MGLFPLVLDRQQDEMAASMAPGCHRDSLTRSLEPKTAERVPTSPASVSSSRKWAERDQLGVSSWAVASSTLGTDRRLVDHSVSRNHMM